jgi:hypothetical protein
VPVIAVGIKKEKKVRAVIVGHFVRYLLLLEPVGGWLSLEAHQSSFNRRPKKLVQANKGSGSGGGTRRYRRQRC